MTPQTLYFTSVLRLLLGAGALLALTVRAKAESDSPAFPHARISVEGPDRYRSSTNIADLVPKGLDPSIVSKMAGTFTNQSSSSTGERTAGELAWRHVAQTEFGDIYVVSYKTADGKRHSGALLFDGNSTAKWHDGDWSVSIAPQP